MSEGQFAGSQGNDVVNESFKKWVLADQTYKV